MSHNKGELTTLYLYDNNTQQHNDDEPKLVNGDKKSQDKCYN